MLAALYAAHHGHSITTVVASAAAGAMLGDNVGYWIGREFGYRLLRRYGSRIGLSPNKVKLGQYLFLRHGSTVVFFGRFVAVLRALAAVLAGVNRMDWRRFLVANAAGAILWASAVGFGTYFFGRAVMHVTRPVGIALAALALAVIVGALLFVRAHLAELEAEAERTARSVAAVGSTGQPRRSGSFGSERRISLDPSLFVPCSNIHPRAAPPSPGSAPQST